MPDVLIPEKPKSSRPRPTYYPRHVQCRVSEDVGSALATYCVTTGLTPGDILRPLLEAWVQGMKAWTKTARQGSAAGVHQAQT